MVWGVVLNILIEGVTHSDKPTNYHLSLHSFLAHFDSMFWLYGQKLYCFDLVSLLSVGSCF